MALALVLGGSLFSPALEAHPDVEESGAVSSGGQATSRPALGIEHSLAGAPGGECRSRSTRGCQQITLLSKISTKQGLLCVCLFESLL